MGTQVNNRRITAADIPAVLPLVEQYWIFEDIGGFEAARTFYRRQGYSERSGYELLDKMLRQ